MTFLPWYVPDSYTRDGGRHMSTFREALGAGPDRSSHKLRRNAIGLPAIVFLLVTGAAPLYAMLFNVPVAVTGSGWGAPSGFIVAGVILIIFSVGYVAMAKRVTAAGGFYSFASHGFNQVVGLAVGLLLAFCYLLFTASIMAVTAYWANSDIKQWTGAEIPAWLITFIILAISMAFAWFRIELTARILGVFMTAELVAILILAIAILFKGGANGITYAPLNPANLFGNPSAKSVFGASAAGLALFAAFWSWVGFEVGPNYGEESHNPRRNIPLGTYLSVIALGIVFTFSSWMFVEGWGQSHAAGAIKAQFSGQFASAFFPLTDRYVGHWMTIAFEVLVVTSGFACQLAFFNTTSRYVYSMGREGILPKALGRTHPKYHSPFVASSLVFLLVAVYAIGFIAYNSSDIGWLTTIGTWSPLMGVFGLMCMEALVSFGIVRYMYRNRGDGYRPISMLIAPLIGGLAMIGGAYLLVDNRTALAGAAHVPFVESIPYVILLVFAAGAALALYYRRFSPERYEAVGRFVHHDVDEPLETSPTLAGTD